MAAAGVFSGVTTQELDDLAAETACYLSTDCPEYSNLAARIAISNLRKLQGFWDLPAVLFVRRWER